jgi:Uma2 family endonuclease
MSTVRKRPVRDVTHYPDSDGRPLAETPEHRDNLANLIEMLRYWYRSDTRTYVSGNTFVYYVPGDRLRHVSPDVFVVRGIPRAPERRRYLVWEEGKGPDVVIELTSASTREEDVDDKFAIYQNTLRVKEFFLFDPYTEYLTPPLQGYRLRAGRYVRIRPVHNRLPSQVLSLHLERNDWRLRLYDPAAKKWLPTPAEEREARLRAEAEVERLRRELAALQRRTQNHR